MKLLKLTVRNFRIHRERTVEFGDPFTLIAGPNESGKSTLLDALNMAFFLRARGSNAHHKSARSQLHEGHPQVEVAFQIGDRIFDLQKTFSGPGGTARLVERGAGTWQNDEVNEKLAELLQTADATKPQGQWSHLLVAQRESGNDPVACANAQHARLLQRLKHEGGGVAVLSDRDSAVMGVVETLRSEFFADGGQIKAKSPLDVAIKAKAESDATLTKARERWSQLAEAEASHASASQAIGDKTAAIAEVQSRLEKRREDAEQVQSLRLKREKQQIKKQSTETRLAALKKADELIEQLRTEVTAFDFALAPLLAQQKTNADLIEGVDVALKEAGIEFENAQNTARAARLEKEFAEALVEHLQLEQQVAESESAIAAIQKLRDDRAAAVEAAEKLPQVTTKDISRLRSLQTVVHQAEAALKATAAKIKVLATPGKVTVGDRTIEVGEEVILTENVELRMGDDFKLAISPGGEAGLAAAGEAVKKATDKFETALHKLSVASLFEAEGAHTQREKLTLQIASLDGQIENARADEVEQSFKERKAALAAATTRFEHCRGAAAIDAFPETLTDARDLRKAKSETAQSAEDALHSAESKRSALQARKTKQLAEKEAIAEKIKAQSEKKLAASTRLQVLIETHGNDEARSKALELIEAEVGTAAATLQATVDALVKLQADTLADDIKQLESAISTHRDALNEAMVLKAQCEALLRQDGTADPGEDLRRAEVSADRAALALAGVQRRADAIRRLHTMFQAERQALAEQFTGPLADKIRFYLQRVFGAGLGVRLLVDEDSFGGITISRSEFGNVAFDFDQLSGGAAEQAAAAVRLAIAELLADQHGGSLPVVFDDAFTNSDPERIQALQSMLHQAAQKGLQIILLSCNSADYRTLPAKQITLARPMFDGAALAPASGPLDESEEDAIAAPPTPANPAPATGSVTAGQKEGFLAALATAGNRSGNQSLRGQLAWDEPTYESVKSALLAEGRIIKGKGKGGSVQIPAAPFDK